MPSQQISRFRWQFFPRSGLDICELSIPLARLRGSWILERTCSSWLLIQVTGTIGIEFSTSGMNGSSTQNVWITEVGKPGGQAANRLKIAMTAPKLPLTNSDWWRARWSWNSVNGKQGNGCNGSNNAVKNSSAVTWFVERCTDTVWMSGHKKTTRWKPMYAVLG